MTSPVDECVDALASGVSTMTVRDRRELLLLAKWKNKLMENITFLESTKKYISRQDRNLLSTFLTIYERRYRQDCSAELVELLKSTKSYLNATTRINIKDKLRELLESSELNDLRMCSDSERFTSMVGGETLFEKDWITLCSIGVVRCNVLPRVKKIELFGTKPKDQFFEDIKTHWGFDHPQQYFLYTGVVSVPEGTCESDTCESGTRLFAGSNLDVIQPFVKGYSL